MRWEKSDEHLKSRREGIIWNIGTIIYKVDLLRFLTGKGFGGWKIIGWSYSN